MRTAFEFLVIAVLCGAGCFGLAWSKYAGPIYISGTVVNVVTGVPVPNTKLYFQEMNGASAGPTTDASGHFQYFGHRPYICCFLFPDRLTSASLLQGEIRSGFAGRGLEIHRGLVIPLVPPTQLSGHVYDEHSHPLAHCEVDATTDFPEDGPPFRGEAGRFRSDSAQSDASGVYRFSRLGVDRYSVIAQCQSPAAPARAQLYPKAITLTPGAHITDIDFHLTPATIFTVRGRVTLSDGSKALKWPDASYSHDLSVTFSDPALAAFDLHSACDWRTPDQEFTCRLVSGSAYQLHFQVDGVMMGGVPSVPPQEANVPVESEQTLNLRLSNVARPATTPANPTPAPGLSKMGTLRIRHVCPENDSSAWITIQSDPVLDFFSLVPCSYPTEWTLPTGSYRLVSYLPGTISRNPKLMRFLSSQAQPATVSEGHITEITLKVWTPADVIHLALRSLSQ